MRTPLPVTGTLVLPSRPPAVNTTGGFFDSFFGAGYRSDPVALAEIDAILYPRIISTALH
jgi:hypothetical protein